MTWDAKDRQRCVASLENEWPTHLLHVRDDLRGYETALTECLEAIMDAISPRHDARKCQAVIARYTIEKEPSDG